MTIWVCAADHFISLKWSWLLSLVASIKGLIQNDLCPMSEKITCLLLVYFVNNIEFACTCLFLRTVVIGDIDTKGKHKENMKLTWKTGLRVKPFTSEIQTDLFENLRNSCQCQFNIFSKCRWWVCGPRQKKMSCTALCLCTCNSTLWMNVQQVWNK